MTHHPQHESPAQHKERLRRQCKAYRTGIEQSGKAVHASLGADAIAKSAIALVSSRAQSAWAGLSDLLDLKNISGAKLQRLVPLLVSGATLLSRRKLFKPVLRGALVAGTAGAALYFFSRKKKTDGKHVALREHL